MRKASREIISPIEGASFHMTHFKAPVLCHEDYWHFHPEFEIVYVPHGKGKRFIGYKVSRYTGGDLVLLGPNILHNTFNFGFESPASSYEEYVIQFKRDQLETMTKQFPEFTGIAKLLDRAETGIAIGGKAKHRIGSLIKKMNKLPPFPRLMQLFSVLREMSVTADAQDLKARESLPLSTIHSSRIQQVYQIIQTRYQDEVSTRQIAGDLAMTESSFCRFFKQATGKTLKQALMEVRIQKACLLLTGSDLSIASVASHAGFNNISLFNRAFKTLTKSTPQQYRRSMQVNLVVN
ncbi:AraC family transcriptional regulator [Puia sp.]|uniref:AraC family transcriptional regulator n=1 Tax=Puia sp. TaxID=2045100 RepID=UPI002F40545C